jgi:lysozyme
MSRNLRSVLLALAFVGAVGCSDGQDASMGAGYVVGTHTDELTKVCGADKYSGVQGADVSKWQGNFDWKAANVTFGFARISDGTNYIDSYFDANWANMKAAGVLRGAYQFFRPGQNATTQANMMVAKVGKLGPGDLPCVIDVEATDGQSAATIASKVKTWLEIVEQGTGKKPIIYTGPYFWQDKVGTTAFSGYPLWIAHYGATCPSIPDGWSKWTFWQYCDGNTQYCTNGKGWDRNVFNGSHAELKALANASVAPSYGAKYVEQSFPLASSALTMTVGETISAYITLQNVGTASWDASTRLGTTEPRDRASPFADSSWLAPNRPSGVSGTVAPGESYQFTFNLRAPDAPGTYFENFGVLAEGITWFSDSGQSGPPDNQLEAQILVLEGPGGSGGESGAGGGSAGDSGGSGASGSSGSSNGSGGGSGSGGLSGSTGGGAGSSGNQASDDGEGDVDGGCACRAGGSTRSGRTSPLALLLALGLLRRRKPRSSAG